MAAFLKNLRRTATTDDLAELRQLVARLESQSSNLEQLVQHADRSIGQLQRLGTLGERISVLERQLAALDQFAAQLSAGESRLAGLGASQQRLEGDLAEATAGLERTRGEVGTLARSVSDAMKLREDLSEFLALEGPFREMRQELDRVAALAEGFRMELGRLREQHESTVGRYRDAGSRFEAFEGDWQRTTRTLAETGHRIAGLEQMCADFAPVAEAVAHTRRDLAAARAQADQLTQKVALLEQQRDAVDRATAKLEHLASLVQRTDASLERQAELGREATELRTQLQSLSGSQGALLERTRNLAERLERLQGGQDTAERGLALLKENLDQNAERVALEGRGLEGVAQRIADLRQHLAEQEDRVSAVTAAADRLTGTAARADALGTQVADLGAQLAQVVDLGARVRAGLGDLDRLETSINGLTERTCRVEESGPMLTQAVRDLASLTATHEAIRDALEQLRASREELGRTQGTVESTRGWLGDTERALATLREDLAGLDRMRATLDALRQEVDRVSSGMSLVESRRALVEDVQRRLGEAAGLGAAIEERARGLTERLDSAQDRLDTLEPRLDEVGRASSQLVSLGADLRELEQRVRAMQGTLSGVEEQARGLETLADRMRELTRETEQRQNALQRAAEHLDRATALRQEAAAAAETLADRARELDSGVEQAGERLASLDQLARDLEARTATLGAVQERLVAFEGRLAEWRGAEQQLTQALEQAAARQATVANLQGEIRALFELAERAQNDARVVAEAQPQLARTRAELDGLLGRLSDADGVLRLLEQRRRQLDTAEERLALADTMLEDVQRSLETLLVQKAQVDHFLEKATSLTLEARHAEALLDALREERRVADRIRTSLHGLRRPEQQEQAEAVE